MSTPIGSGFTPSRKADLYRRARRSSPPSNAGKRLSYLLFVFFEDAEDLLLLDLFAAVF